MRKILMIAMAMFCDMSGASIAWEGMVSDIHFMSDGVVLFYTSGSRNNIPACGAAQSTRFAFNATTAIGKNQLAGLLAAHGIRACAGP